MPCSLNDLKNKLNPSIVSVSMANAKWGRGTQWRPGEKEKLVSWNVCLNLYIYINKKMREEVWKIFRKYILQHFCTSTVTPKHDTEKPGVVNNRQYIQKKPSNKQICTILNKQNAIYFVLYNETKTCGFIFLCYFQYVILYMNQTWKNFRAESSGEKD